MMQLQQEEMIKPKEKTETHSVMISSSAPTNTIKLNLGEGASIEITSPENLDKVVEVAIDIAKRYKKRAYDMAGIM